MAERRLNRRQVIAGAALASLSLGPAASQETDVVRGGVPMIALPDLPTRLLDPASDRWEAAWLRSLVYDTPLRRSRSGEIVAAAAIGFSLTGDGRRAELICRSNVAFSSGEAMTAADIAASIARAIELATPDDAWRWERVERVAVEPDTLVHLHLSAPDATLDATLASSHIPVIPGGAGAPESAFAALPPGTGPFVPARDDGMLHFRPHRRHWVIGQPRFDGCSVVAVADDIERTTRLVTGTVDVAPDIPSLDIPLLDNDPGIALVGGLSRRACAIVPNHARDPLVDVRVRRAIASAIDRDTLVEGATAGTAEPARGIAPPDHWAGSDDLEAGEVADADDVREQLASLGLMPGWTLRLICPDDTPVLANTAVLLQEQLAGAGIAVGIDLLDPRAFDRARSDGGFDLMMTLLPAWSDPHEIAHPWLHSTGARNAGAFASDRVDRLLERARGVPDRETRGGLYLAIQRAMVSEVALIPLFRTPWLDGVRARIEGYALYPQPSGRGIASAWFERS